MIVFQVFSGNLGDTLNALPILSGIHKSTGEAVQIIYREKMKMFQGIKELLEYQDCIDKVIFESEVKEDIKARFMGLTEDFDKHSNRPWETVRLDESFREQNPDVEYEVDDDFILSTPQYNMHTDTMFVGDRKKDPRADTRRKFNLIESSNVIPPDQVVYLNYNEPLMYNISLMKSSSKPFISTFTGISIIADLCNIENIVLYDDEIGKWDNKSIDYSFNKHYYRDRKSKAVHVDDFNFSDYEA